MLECKFTKNEGLSAVRDDCLCDVSLFASDQCTDASIARRFIQIV